MCAQFLIQADSSHILRALGFEENLFETTGVDNSQSKLIQDSLQQSAKIRRVLPYTKAPVVTKNGLKMMNFSLIPSWSKEPKPKFATHNARLETIDEKATWKKPFATKHVIVPISSFIEPIYEGELAGYMVAFDGSELMFAAGVYDEWINPATGEIIESFAIITTEPCEFIRISGHDRQPIFLDKAGAREWLYLEQQSASQPKQASNKISPQEMKSFLLKKQISPKFTTHLDRPLKPGWQKRNK